MLSEMCNLIDCYAMYILGEKFEKNWPEKSELRNEFYINNILELIIPSGTGSDNEVKFIIYSPRDRDKELKLLSAEEVEELLNAANDKELYGLISLLIRNPKFCTNFYEEPNKWLGGRRGLGSFFPFIFKLPRIEEEIEKKVEETGNALKRYFHSDAGNEFVKIFSDEGFLKFLKNAHKQFNDKKDNYYILILLDNADPYKEFLDSKELIKNSITITSSRGSCQICGETGETGYPVIGSSYDEKKEFLTSPTKGTGRISVCSTCGFKINVFYQLLKKSGILPVFIDRDATEIEASNIRDYIGGGDESYSKFITYIYNKLEGKEYKMAHYLVMISPQNKDVIWVDYVSSLKWLLDWDEIVFNFSDDSVKIEKTQKNRREIEKIFYDSCFSKDKKSNMKSFRTFFFSVKNKNKTGNERGEKTVEEYGIYLAYKYRDHFYRFVYKNECPFLKNDIIEFVNLSIAQKYRSIAQKYRDKLSKGYRDRHSAFLEAIVYPIQIFFNIPNLIPGESMKTLKDLEKKLDDLLSKEEGLEIDDEEWAYCAGAFYRYLTTLSKSREASLELDPIINATTIGDILSVLARTFERYQYRILQPFLDKWGYISAYAFTPPNKDKSFERLKPFFYTGFVDPYALKKFYSQTETKR